MTFQEAIITFFFFLAIIGFYLKIKQLNKEEKEYLDKKIRKTIAENNDINYLAETITAYHKAQKQGN